MSAPSVIIKGNKRTGLRRMNTNNQFQRSSGCPEYEFVQANYNEEAALVLEHELSVSPIFARILSSRGLNDVASAQRFLHPALERDWKSPLLLPGMKDAAERVVTAINNRERICVFGDYDLDGISATALTLRGLRGCGGLVEAILPRRLEDGYGLTPAAVERILAKKPSLVVTVDCGISAAPEIELLRKAGLDVVVTDHHEPGDLMPTGIPLANPKLDPAYSSDGSQLAGAGVALKLVQAVCRAMGRPFLWKGLIDLATLGTVADVMPLVGENRALVAAGLDKMRSHPNVGIAALAALAKVPLEQITSERISFALAPRLNAAGRVASPVDALKLLLADNPLEAARLAQILDDHNKTRQMAEADLSAAVNALIERTYHGEPAIVLAGEGWHDGVKGIVASRIAQKYNVPTILCSIEEGVAIGSARSVGQIDLFQALEKCSTHLLRFGGHAGAAGLAVNIDELDGFRHELGAYLETLPLEARRSKRVIDAAIDIDELSISLADELSLLEPFGEANKRPLFYSRAITVKNACTVGKEGQHLKFQAYENGAQIPAIFFRCPGIERVLGSEEMANISYRFEVDCWQGHKRLQLQVQSLEILQDPVLSEDTPQKEGRAFLDELFASADDTLKQRDYAGILENDSFFTKVAGVTFEGRQEVIARFEDDEPLMLRRDPLNEFDASAIGVYAPRFETQIGFLNRDLAAVLAPALDEGAEYVVKLGSVTGGDDGRSYGVNIEIARKVTQALREEAKAYRANRRDELKGYSDAELHAFLIKHFIGTGALHKAQQESLDLLGRGRNVLTVMATGRGKSLIFHMQAAKLALLENKASIFVYPLRALVADQAYHLQESFAELGLEVAVVTGETSKTAQAEAFEALSKGKLDIILTTPEYLHFHGNEFAPANRIGFVVIDEAHHIGQSRAGNRPAYARLGDALAEVNADGKKPATLAVTATASDEVAQRIIDTLGITDAVLDPSVRSNLVIDDQRDHEHKERFVLDLARKREKSVVYVNSREEAVKLARIVRKAVGDLAWKTAFYHGGLSKAARHEIERRFRTGEVEFCVATSAFGEGVNIPDIRHVVLYHLPFNDVEFNQMSGRGGRDGTKATIHLLFGKKDARINEYILQALAPERDALAAVYRALKDIELKEGNHFSVSNGEIAQRANAYLPRGVAKIDDKGVSTGIGVFRDLGFLTTQGRSVARLIEMLPVAGKLDLTSSTRYSEGLDEIDEFDNFRQWVLAASPEELLERFNKPILPRLDSGKVTVVR